MSIFADRFSKTIRRSAMFGYLCLVLSGNAIIAFPADSAWTVEHPWLSLHSAALWSPALKSNLPMPINTLSIGLMTGGLVVDVGVAASYSFGNLAFSFESNGSGAGVSSRRNDQLSLTFLAGSYTRSSLLEFGVHAIAGYILTTSEVVHSIIGDGGHLEQKIGISDNTPTPGYGVQACMLVRLSRVDAAGITVRYVRSKLGGVWSLGLGVSTELL